ncbi:thioredoxin family protein [Gemmatimonadota bacterium]
MAIHDLTTEAELEKVLSKAEILLLDFWAPWCPPCQAFAPVFEEASQRHPEVAFCRVNTKEEEELSGPLEVAHIPSLVAVRNRIMVALQPGYFSGDQLEDLIRQVEALDMDDLRDDPDDTQTVNVESQ